MSAHISYKVLFNIVATMKTTSLANGVESPARVYDF